MSRGVHVKRLLVAVIAINVVIAPHALAEPKNKVAKVAAIKCAPTKASGHAPKDVAPAQKLPKKLARTLTFETNCGNIVVTTVGAKAPITITQLSTLAKRGYFDEILGKGVYQVESQMPITRPTSLQILL
jgi:peptidyl-prolyl cis-trans isomerase B (cyclophilin B)